MTTHSDWPHDDLRLEMFTLLRLNEARENRKETGQSGWFIGDIEVTHAISSLVRKEIIEYAAWMKHGWILKGEKDGNK